MRSIAAAHEYAVSLHGVWKRYEGPPPLEALKPCDLDVELGEFVSIVGPSGSGKSTLLNLLGLLDRPTGGRIFLNGTDTTDLGAAERTRLRAGGIGFVFQSFELLRHRTVLENVMLSGLYLGLSERARRQAALEALASVGIVHKANVRPSQVSGGERQRVAIARAISCRPSLLLCDEPTGNLDSVTSEGIMRLLSALNSDGTTILVITHDPAIAAHTRRHVRIRDGILTSDDLDPVGR